MEPPKSLNTNNTKFVSSRYALPLFMISRNRIKYRKLHELRKYIKKRNHIYNTCNAEDSDKATLQHLQHVVGTTYCLDLLGQDKSAKVQEKSSAMQLKKPWQLPPNRYDTTKIPYANKSGDGGAHWPKDHTHQSKLRTNVRQQHFSSFSLPATSERIFTPCNRHKGVFLTNARERRATTRCMISDVSACYKNPSDPAPTTYSPIYEKPALSTSLDIPNPHLFHRLSTVPVTRNGIHTPHTSFTAAPGRYEIRYPNTCPCSSRYVYQPQIDLLIEKEKLKKFRRLSFEKIKARHYTSPDWRHVKGRGFRYLFMGAKRSKHTLLTEQELKRQKNLKLYPDAKYIAMINNPLRTPFSLRSSPVLNALPQIKFNCVAKKVTRKQLKNNKKIAFNSSQDRFRDSYRLPILTQKQQEELKQTLPLERQFRDHPIMNKRPSEIISKLDETPKHMLPNYVPRLRKKLFKFQPLPQAKVLVTETDTNLKELSKEGYYLTPLDPKRFFKDNA